MPFDMIFNFHSTFLSPSSSELLTSHPQSCLKVHARYVLKY